ncbi:MAG: hypothetical protein Q4C20_07530 [Erysipelotrichaceae bacterium]|nr:hypothetical protein [Erysipelotrichaceae bacterium]
MKYKNIILVLVMHAVSWVIGTALSETALIPGETVKLTVTGLIILAVYAAGTLYTALQSEKNELIFIEIWKVCLLTVFTLVRFTNGSHGALAALVFLGPFRPLITVNMKRAFLITFGLLAAETMIEMFLINRDSSKPA